LQRRCPVDLVLCHSHPVAALAGLPFRWLSGARLVMVCHGDIFERPPGTYEPGLTWLYRRTTRLAYRQVDSVTVISPAMREWAERGGAAAQGLALIPNGINPEEIGLSPDLNPPSAGRDLRVLFVGRIEPVKGVGVLLEAWGQLMRQGWPGQLRLIGPVTPAWQGEFVSLCGSIPKGLGYPNVRPMAPRLELGESYRWADVVVIPSLSEPLGMVALEAMAAGRAIIGTRVGGLPFLLADGEAGILIAPNSPEELAQALRHLGEEPAELARLGSVAHARQASRFTWAACGEALHTQIDQLLSSKECDL